MMVYECRAFSCAQIMNFIFGGASIPSIAIDAVW
jgi:hypothetical protein